MFGIVEGGRGWALRAAAVTALAGMLYGSYELGGQARAPQAATPPTAEVRLASDAGNQRVEKERGLFAELAKRLSPTVVHLKVRSRQVGMEGHPPVPPEFRRFFGVPDGDPAPPREGQGQGSGVIVSRDGYILTNNHVVRGATEITVVLDDNQELKGRVVGTDSKTDLAVIKVDSSKALPFAELGDSDAAEIGDWVMAIGNPFGLSHTVTVGVLSGKGRVLGGAYDQYLQTDASINPGNSGGPLFDTSGRVVGINTAILSDGQGIGFAIPVNQARQVADQLRSNGRVTRGFLGLGIQPVTPRMAAALGLPDGTRGALVGSVVPGGPGAKAGVREGDVIVGFNGRALADERELLNAAASAPVGSQAKLEVMRDGRRRSLDLTVARRPAEDGEVGAASPAPAEEGAGSAVGASVRDLTPALARQRGLEATEGALVVGVEPGSAAEKAGLEPGDVIRRVGNTPVRGARDFQRLAGEGRDLALLVVRDGSQVFLLVERDAG